MIKFRLEHEYGAKCDFRELPIAKACWLTSDNKMELKDMVNRRSGVIASDKSNTAVFFAESEWMLKIVKEAHPEVIINNTTEYSIKRKLSI